MFYYNIAQLWIWYDLVTKLVYIQAYGVERNITVFKCIAACFC